VRQYFEINSTLERVVMQFREDGDSCLVPVGSLPLGCLMAYQRVIQCNLRRSQLLQKQTLPRKPTLYGTELVLYEDCLLPGLS
jgi:hypothetical protein